MCRPICGSSRQAYAGHLPRRTSRNWNDPRIAKTNPGVKLPNLTLVTVVRQDSSGTTFAFTKHLDAVNDTWRARYGAANAGGLARERDARDRKRRRRGQDQAVGRIDWLCRQRVRPEGRTARGAARESSRALRRSLGGRARAAALAEIRLPDSMRAYIPDPAAPDSYPIVTLTWILLRGHYADARKAAALRDMFRWCLTDGQQYAAELGYVPLPVEIVQALARATRPRSGHLARTAPGAGRKRSLTPGAT